eukprot:TRINITY_DN2705_c0_g1_i1.p1 TRINITY_DN2705_c0_g1~~TRINITY_DN2705_c0_g1_i1.p1  ORF type:complete len:239 (-),score=16.46 TRINITY_DN2705_c0_g1_i1:29-745(-)
MTVFNIFRITGDVLHLASIILLILKIQSQRSCAGISYKTQLLYTIVFIARYIDMLNITWIFDSDPKKSSITFLSFYNTILKIIFIASSVYTCYLIKFKFPHTYDRRQDSFRIWFLIVPCFILGLIFNHSNESFNIIGTFTDILWAFSIFLEAVAIFPQLVVLQRTQDVETFTGHYIFALGGYRLFYLFNWIYRYFTETRYHSDLIAVIAGLIQTALYLDFFYYYLSSKWIGRKMVLPS